MNCTECAHEFSMIDIPVQERIYGKYSARFQCPHCKCWLQAGRRFKIFSIIGLCMLTISSVATATNVMGLTDASLEVLLLIAVTGVSVGAYSLFNIKLKKVT